MKYTIYIKDFQLTTIIGLLEEERIKPQKIVVNCKIKYKKKDKSFIDYTKVAKIIEKMLHDNKYLLIEEALKDITDELKLNFESIYSIKLKIFKPQIVENCSVGAKIFKKY